MAKTATKPTTPTTNAPRKMNRRSETAKEGGPRPIDVHVGSRVRLRRTLLGMSQEKLGEAIGLTFQQVQKYERGANRIGASRLYDLSRVLDVPVSFFFDDMPEGVGSQGGSGGSSDMVRDLSSRRHLELVRNFDAIQDEGVQDSIYQLVKAAAQANRTADAA